MASRPQRSWPGKPRHPGTLVARPTFPLLYPVLAPERPPDGKPAPTVVAGQAGTRTVLTLVAKRSTFPMLYPVLAPERPRMASRPQRSWLGEPGHPRTLVTGRRFRCFMPVLARKGPRLASRDPARSWPGIARAHPGTLVTGRRFRCFIRCLHRKGPRMATRPQRRNFRTENPERIEPSAKRPILARCWRAWEMGRLGPPKVDYCR